MVTLGTYVENAVSSRRRSRSISLAAFAVIAILEVFDYLTGPFVSFGLLFLIPVVWLAWHVGARAGVVAAIFAVTCEAVVDLAWPQVSGLGVYLWNAYSRAAVLVLGALAAARIRRTGEQLSVANTRLDRLLASEQEAHEDTQRRFGLVADALTDYAIVQFDADGRARAWNAATPRITGREAEDIEGCTLDELFPVADPGEVVSAPGELTDRAELERWTLRWGQGRYWASMIVYAAGVAGRRQRRLAIVRDVTPRKEAEEALRRARDEAVALAHELETFTYSVAHDLRAPLRAVDGLGAMLELDAEGQLDEKARSYVTRMRAASRRMGRLVDDLLEMTRLGRTPLRASPIDLTAIARSISNELRENDPRRSVDFVVAEGLSAVADPHLVTILLQKLLENAWKFTSRQERARIEVGAVAGPEPAFYIRDDGVGFDMKYVNRLFRPFERLHTAEEFEGTGIGLATVRRIVERHGGRVWAEGSVGGGACVYFTLPGSGSTG